MALQMMGTEEIQGEASEKIQGIIQGVGMPVELGYRALDKPETILLHFPGTLDAGDLL